MNCRSEPGLSVGLITPFGCRRRCPDLYCSVRSSSKIHGQTVRSPQKHIWYPAGRSYRATKIFPSSGILGCTTTCAVVPDCEKGAVKAYAALSHGTPSGHRPRISCASRSTGSEPPHPRAAARSSGSACRPWSAPSTGLHHRTAAAGNAVSRSLAAWLVRPGCRCRSSARLLLRGCHRVIKSGPKCHVSGRCANQAKASAAAWLAAGSHICARSGIWRSACRKRVDFCVFKNNHTSDTNL